MSSLWSQFKLIRLTAYMRDMRVTSGDMSVDREWIEFLL
ncbi:hypothetical protein CRE_31625 [Caenorhabditis remanei]|uniref:Uncharacterized protein n=1 Tax=Caenorhabditis remanei TaxID=31234 RepID=E3NTD0_CAERE|nr:hypothetical protein CRE_31625 [Caenorhabditis remanei]